MHLLNLVLLLAGAASAGRYDKFYIHHFQAAHIAHSSTSSVSFELFDPHGTDGDCAGSHTTSYANNLGHFYDYTCTNKAGTWGLFQDKEGNYTLLVRDREGHTGTKVFPKGALQEYTNDGVFYWQYLKVPKHFKIPYDETS